MTTPTVKSDLLAEQPLGSMSRFLHLAGFRYWTASLLPALVGTTLPFWPRPPDFSFRWLAAIEFLVATILFHAGLSFLQALFEHRSTTKSTRLGLLGGSGACIVAACLLGLLINSQPHPKGHVYENIFIVFGVSVIIVGLLFVVPPVNLGRRIGREIVLAFGCGMIPVLGAYLVQVADLTRTVYVASLPLVVATALWVWVDELATRTDDEKDGCRTLVMEFGVRFSGRYGVLGLVLGLFASILIVVISRSVSPWALVALLTSGLAGKIVVVSWTDYLSSEKMVDVRRKAVVLHVLTCGIIAASSLPARLT